MRFYVHKESISHPSKTSVKAWIKAVPNTFFKIGEKYLNYQLEYEQHDCERNKFLFLQVTSYYSDGTSQDVFSKPSAWIDVLALSPFFKKKHQYLCKDKKIPSHQNRHQDQIHAAATFDIQVTGRLWYEACMLDLFLKDSNLIEGGIWLCREYL